MKSIVFSNGFSNNSDTGPQRSLELTSEVRWTLLGFFCSYFALCALVGGSLVWATSSDLPQVIEPLPFVQTDAFLPLVFVGALLYSGLVMATYEIYTQLVSAPSEAREQGAD